MRALVIGSGQEDSLLFAGEPNEARAFFNSFKGKAGISEVSLWNRTSGKIKTRKVATPAAKKKAKK